MKTNITLKTIIHKILLVFVLLFVYINTKAQDVNWNDVWNSYQDAVQVDKDNTGAHKWVLFGDWGYNIKAGYPHQVGFLRSDVTLTNPSLANTTFNSLSLGFIDFANKNGQKSETGRTIDIMTLKNENVGIGTTNPFAKLQVEGAIKSTGLTIPITSNASSINIPGSTPVNVETNLFTLPASVDKEIVTLQWGTGCYNLYANIEILVDAKANTITPLSFSEDEGRGLNTLTTTATSITTPYLSAVIFKYNNSSRTLTVTPLTNGCGGSGMSSGMSGYYGTVSNFTVNSSGVGIGTNSYEGSSLTVSGYTYICQGGHSPKGFVLNENTQDYLLWVEKGIVSEDFAIATAPDWKDEVFQPTYKLPTLSEVENYIQENKHLKGIPSETEVKEKGYTVHEMNKAFLEKIENLMLYVIEQDKKIKTLEQEVKMLQTSSNK